MHSGFIQTLSHFTESILAHSPLRENLEEHDCHRWSRRGCESDSQTEPATATPCGRNTQDAARASHHSSSQHSSQSLDVVPYKKDCPGTTALRGWVTAATTGATDGGEKVPGEKKWVDTLESVCGDTRREQLQLNLGISEISGHTRRTKGTLKKANGNCPRGPWSPEIRVSIFWVKSSCWHTQLLCQTILPPARHGNP